MGEGIFIPMFRAHDNAASGGQGLARRVKRPGLLSNRRGVNRVLVFTGKYLYASIIIIHNEISSAFS
jgi:hypothetical protein